MALYWIDGFEHGLLTTGVGGPYSSSGGSPAIVTSPVRTGSRALEMTPSAAVESIGVAPPAGTRVVSESFYVRFATLPSGSVSLAPFINANGNFQVRYNNSTNKFMVYSGTAGAGTDIGTGTVSVDTWYLIDVKLDVSTDSATITGRVNGAGEGTQNATQTAADITSVRFGTGTAETYTAYYDDWCFAVAASGNTTPAYPIGLTAVETLVPTADGSHNTVGANEIEYSATGTDITNSSTDVYTLIDELPLSATLTDYINDVGTSTSAYVEVTFGNLSAGTDVPVDVGVFAFDRDSIGTGTAGAISRILLSDNTAVTPDVRLSSDDPGTTMTLRKKILDRPTGDWDRTKVDGLKARFGFGDGAPDAHFESMFIVVALVPAPASATSLLLPSPYSSTLLRM